LSIPLLDAGQLLPTLLLDAGQLLPLVSLLKKLLDN
jgi:hypothetical protein